MNDIRKILNEGLSYDEFKTLFTLHHAWAEMNNRTSGAPKWFDEPGTLNVFGIRCNTEADFNFGKYNDYLVLIFNKSGGSFDQVLLEVTVDPNRTSSGIAHLRQGVWNSYKVRVHRNASRYFETLGKTIKRWALCQDVNQVEIVRTDGSGNIKKSERGYFGINIHDNGGFADSSLGCTILKNDYDYLRKYLPYVFDLLNEKPVPSNHDNISYCLINHSQLEKYLSMELKREERAEAVNGNDGETSGGAKPAGKEAV